MIVEKDESEFLNKLIQYRRELHKYPELSMKEFETTKRIKKWLKENNIEIIDLPLKVGVVAQIKGKYEGKTIALRADIDALPINEETGFDFSSVNSGVMHACGHDFHMASILGAAIILNEKKSELHGTVRIIFQPAEEIAQGAKFVYEHGVLDGVDAIFGMHNRPDLEVGTIGVKDGPLMASVDRFEIDVIGLGGHAGMPHDCIDPIVVSSQIVSAMQAIVSRNLNPFDNAVISVTRLQSGNTWNVIPDKAELEGTVRTFQNDMREKIKDLMKRTAEGIAKAYGAKIKFRWFSYLPVVDNDPQFEGIARESAEELGYKTVYAERNLGGEDFAFYQEKIPGFFVWVGVQGSEEWHQPSYNLKEEALTVAANYFSNLAIKVLDKWNLTKIS
ncbi:amidohydrolase [Clostridium fermenticellae]|uniref:Amidohydrolase n=1 Tax=Clostridium fermenticellae TaxID=2068654 RepID=A0A386H5K2_9CLOT|nr:M20 peptidase aminoacylase family protein [Clostridium fermenticellae]AYD40930.1 amidohydrolase [Clostridium fermenticellae]